MKRVPPDRVPRLAFNISEAAESLGYSENFFREHVSPELRWIRRGRKKTVAISELERWLEKNGSR
jgi:hypothetical protein